MKRERKIDEVAVFESALDLMMWDLLIGLHTSEARLLYLLISTSAFSDRSVDYKMFELFTAAPEAAGLIELFLGRNAKNIQFEKSDRVTYLAGYATRHKPSLILSMADGSGFDGEDVTSIFHPNFQSKWFRWGRVLGIKEDTR